MLNSCHFTKFVLPFLLYKQGYPSLKRRRKKFERGGPENLDENLRENFREREIEKFEGIA